MFGLGDLRRYSDTMTAKIIIYALAASFFLGFGVISFTGNSGFVEGAVVAKVEGEAITNRDLAVAHQRLYDNYQDQLGDQLTEDVLEQLNLRFQALNMLIEREVLIKEAERLGLVVSPQELKEYIAGISAFQREDGSFDKESYRMILRQQRPAVTPAEFEQQTRRQLMVDKLEQYVKSNVHLREDEILREFLMDTREVNVAYLRFDSADVEARIRVSDDDIRAHYENNIEDYITGEQAEVRLISFSASAYLDSVEVEDAEIRDAYESNLSQYKQEEEVQAAHILLNVPDDATPDEEEATIEEIKALKARAEKGASFVDLAREHSQDRGSARNGGDLGWFPKGRMVPAFETAAFEGQPGEIVGPVKTQFGYHIIQIKDRQEAGTTPLSEAYDDIAARLREIKATDLAGQDAEALVGAMASGEPVDQLVADLTPAPQDRVVNLGSADTGRADVPLELFSVVFESEGNQADGAPMLIEAETGPVVAIVLSRAPSEPKPLAQVQDAIERQVAKDKALSLAAEQSAAALERLKRGESIQQVARRYGARVETTGPFTVRDKEIPGLGESREVRNAAFSLTENNPVPRSTYRVDGAYIVMRLESLREPTPEEYQMERDVRRIETLNERRTDAWRQFIRSVKSRAAIELENAPADILPRG